jgi:hypothetical protein
VSGALSTILENRGEQWVSFSAFGLGVLNFKKKDIIERSLALDRNVWLILIESLSPYLG